MYMFELECNVRMKNVLSDNNVHMIMNVLSGGNVNTNHECPCPRQAIRSP